MDRDFTPGSRTRALPASVLWAVLAFLILGAFAARADEAHRGWFLGGGAHLLLMGGEGDWDGVEFDPTAPDFNPEKPPLGLNWAEKLLIGGKPLLGYRFGDRFALQAGYAYCLPKRSFQIFRVTENNISQVYRLDWEWRQANADLVGVYYPSDDWNFHFFAGAEWARIELDAVPSANVSSTNIFGEVSSDADFEFYTDTVDTWGAVIGAGLEMPSESLSVSTVLTLQYSTSRIDEQLFITPDFRLGVGGFALFGGLKWYFESE